MKILVAEDDAMTRLALARNIEKWGYEVVAVEDGKRALDLLGGETAPRIAILDWIMPELEGVEICRQLSQRTGAQLIYTILLTIKSEKDSIVEALDCGAHDFLTKPVHIGELRSRVAVGARLLEAEDKLTGYAREIETKNRELENALAEIKTLQGFIPICASCKKIRDDEGYWQQLEEYIQARSDAKFSHGICPDCIKLQYPEIAERILNREKG